ncbi:DNA-binding helix-turn-helix protein [Weissella oryzae SG25]|uniref:DNA-binding helix-turn-helix protein n=1 Tax=Weissella oryzae (strain DSM 25784 / JCM 18191 / LMG 30913 / SG25) TaxID=1329250 RepID=A0A069CS40_WEIOS|nr:helix-turn-helix transcriptional regulator [Weissella oryzae]GAK30202.1 DNA-binding helix-turn-helix protein [Weissella oryzae SG25]
MQLGEKITKLRQKMRMNQGEFARLIHVHQSTVSRYERNHIRPDTDTLLILSSLAEVSIHEFLSNRGE